MNLYGFFLTPSRKIRFWRLYWPCEYSHKLVTDSYLGIYSASKAALTLMSETLRLEMAPLGINVLTAMAGAVAGTNFHQSVPSINLPSTSPYKPIEQQIVESGQNDPKGSDQTAFANQLVKDILKRKSGFVWRGQMASMTKWVSKWVPSKLLDGMLTSGRGTVALKNIMAGLIVPPSAEASLSSQLADSYTSFRSNWSSETNPDMTADNDSAVAYGRFGRLSPPKAPPKAPPKNINLTEMTFMDRGNA